MSILIKGMEMPLSCDKCPLMQRYYNGMGGEDYYCGLDVWGDVFDAPKTRPEGCPLVEIPTPHGRLVDADRLRVILCRLLDRQTDEIAKHTVRWIIQILEKLETVVEGEDENDD